MILSKYIFSAIFIPVVILSGCSLNSHIEKIQILFHLVMRRKGKKILSPIFI